MFATLALSCVLHDAFDAETAPRPASAVLQAESFRHYIENFNQYDHELLPSVSPDAALKHRIGAAEYGNHAQSKYQRTD